MVRIMIPENLVFGRGRMTAEIFGSSMIFLWCLDKEMGVVIFYSTVNSNDHMVLIMGRSTTRNTITILITRYGLGCLGISKQLLFFLFPHISYVGIANNSHWGRAAWAI